jgi:pSer/pThr/pTyr-binding forkhead associated (FHA) protein
MKVGLVVLTAGKMEGQTIPITLTQFLIGRDRHCHLRPANPVISNRHCAILVRGSKVLVRDFESTNGTFVNNEQVHGEAVLKNEDRLRIGPLEFAVHIEISTAVDKATPLPPSRPPGELVDDEAAAALLLSLQEEGTPPAGSPGVDAQGIPTGSTVMEMPAASATGETPAEQVKQDDKTKADAAKPKVGDTSTAANSLLQKYLRRPRKE